VSETPNPLPPPFGGFDRPPGFAESPQEDARRRAVLARLRVVFMLGLAAFSLLTWLFVRRDGSGGLLFFDPGPGVTVRRHLDALNRGDLRAAYELFSQHYREEVSLPMYHNLVTSHWQMFRTRRADYDRRDDSPGRTVIHARLLSANGERYLARFTMVHSAGRWWIDDLRWGSAPSDSGRIRI
jgi:hypothetical protein